MGRFGDWWRRVTRQKGAPAPGLRHWRQGLPVRLLVARDVVSERLCELTAAADYWQRAVGHDLWCVEPVEVEHPAMLGIPEGCTITLSYSDLPARETDLARTWIQPEAGSDGQVLHFCEVEIPCDLASDDFERALAHELGHCLGLGHSTITDALMRRMHDAAAWSLHPDELAHVRSQLSVASRAVAPYGNA